MSRKSSPVFLLSIVALLLTTSSQMVNPILALFAYTDLRASLSEVGLVISIFFVASTLSKFPSAFFLRGDRIIQGLFLGIICNTIALLGYWLVPDVGLMLVVRLLHGISLGVNAVTLLTVSASLASSETEMVAAVERYSAATAMGLMLGPAVGTVLVSIIGLRDTLLAAAIVSGPGAVLTYQFYRRTSGIWVGASITKFSFQDFLGLMKSRLLLLSYVIYFSFSYVYGLVVSYAPIEAKLAYAMSETAVTALFAGYFALTLITRVLLRRVLPRFGFSRPMAFGLILPALGLLFMGSGLGQYLFSVGFVIVGFGHGLIFPLTAILVAKGVVPTQRIVANSIYLTAFDLGNVFAPLVASGTSVAFGVGLSLAASSLVPLIGLSLIPRLKREVLE